MKNKILSNKKHEEQWKTIKESDELERLKKIPWDRINGLNLMFKKDETLKATHIQELFNYLFISEKTAKSLIPKLTKHSTKEK